MSCHRLTPGLCCQFELVLSTLPIFVSDSVVGWLSAFVDVTVANILVLALMAACVPRCEM